MEWTNQQRLKNSTDYPIGTPGDGSYLRSRNLSWKGHGPRFFQAIVGDWFKDALAYYARGGSKLQKTWYHLLLEETNRQRFVCFVWLLQAGGFFPTCQVMVAKLFFVFQCFWACSGRRNFSDVSNHRVLLQQIEWSGELVGALLLLFQVLLADDMTIRADAECLKHLLSLGLKKRPHIKTGGRLLLLCVATHVQKKET